MPPSLTPIERERILAAKLPLLIAQVGDSFVAFSGKTDHITNRLFSSGSRESFLELLAQANQILTQK